MGDEKEHGKEDYAAMALGRAPTPGDGGADRGVVGGIQVAALFVVTNGCYFGLPGVDPWDIHRDARLYAGPHPVVAHPPCARWSMLANVNLARYGTKIGDDGGCFESALSSVRKFGGVLEHPAQSMAWKKFGIPRPASIMRKGSTGRWTGVPDGGWTCEVSQRSYGHRAQKLTWLFYSGATPPAELDWTAHRKTGVVIGGPRSTSTVENMGKRERLATPERFRDMLISLAMGAR